MHRPLLPVFASSLPTVLSHGGAPVSHLPAGARSGPLFAFSADTFFVFLEKHGVLCHHFVSHPPPHTHTYTHMQILSSQPGPACFQAPFCSLSFAAAQMTFSALASGGRHGVPASATVASKGSEEALAPAVDVLERGLSQARPTGRNRNRNSALP